MNKEKIILGLCFVVVLLLGVVMGQWSKNQSVNLTQTEAPIAVNKQQITLQVQPLLTDIQYWVSQRVDENKKFGYAAWIEFESGGVIIIEKCSAANYEQVSIQPEQDPYLPPTCHTVAESKIALITEKQLMLEEGEKESDLLVYDLDVSSQATYLVLTLDGVQETFISGSKNVLWEQLNQLPSVQKAYREAFTSMNHK